MDGTSGAGRRRADDAVRVARVLAQLGPLPGATAAKLLGWTADRWWGVVGNRTGWFDITGKGWVLTAAGREAVASPGPADDVAVSPGRSAE